MITVAEQLAAIRAEKGLTLRAVAKRAGISHETIRHLEGGGALLSTAEAVAAALKRKITLTMDGRLVHFPGTIGAKLRKVRTMLGKRREDIVGLSPTTIRDIEDGEPVRLISVELYAALLSTDGAVFRLEVRPLTKLDRIILQSKENAHVRSHC